MRRLTNDQYRNSLADLFPTMSLALPALPRDATLAGFENAAEAQRPSDVRVARVESIAATYGEALRSSPAALRSLTGCADWSTPATASACAVQFLSTFGRRIYRRPLTDAERERLMERFETWTAAANFESAVALTVSTMLQSPHFLYRLEPMPTGASLGQAVALDGFEVASRLSFLLWESAPDDGLLAAAERGALGTSAGIRDEAVRMLADARASRVRWSFIRQWLGLDRISDEEHGARTGTVDAAWTPATQAAALGESRRFVEATASGGGTLADLLTSPKAWLDPETARIYGMPPGSRETTLPAAERAGILTRVAFLAGYSHRGATSPPIRAYDVMLKLLCEPPLMPPPGIDTTPPGAAADGMPKTNRGLFEERTRPALCRGCHERLDGIGFGFETYSSSGAFQRLDNALPVDATGALVGTDVDGTFDGAVELSRRLSSSAEVHACAARTLVRYALGRAPVAAEEPWVERVAARFARRDVSLDELLVDIVASSTFRARLVEEDPQ